MQQLPFSILFAWAFFVVKFYRTIYSFTFSAAFGRSLSLSLPLFVLRDMLAILVRLHNTQILCTFPRNVNNSWFLSRKLLSAGIWKISPVQCASMCVCVCGFFWCDSMATVPCVGLSQFWHRFAFCMVSLCPFFSFFSIFSSVVVDAATKFHSLRFMICYFAATVFSFSLYCIALHTLCTLCYATKAATSNENRRKTDHKKWAKLNYSRI